MFEYGKKLALKCGIDIEKVREDFPIFSNQLDAKGFIYLDNAATTHKPEVVIEAVRAFERSHYATICRGAYSIGELATKSYEESRGKVAKFLGVEDVREIIVTSGTTQSINLVANSFGKTFLREGDEVIISNIEHHANIIPWQVICKEKGVSLKVIPVNDKGELMLEEYEKLLNQRTKLVSLVYISNVLGTINNVQEVIKKAHEYGAKVLIDGAQSSPHKKVDVKELGCDFYAFSAHKVYGPTGVGILYGRYELLEEMEPYVTGGGMIDRVKIEKTSYAKPPTKFEAGTPPISQMIGLGRAIDYIDEIGLDKIERYEKELLIYGTEVLLQVPGLRIVGEAKEKASLISFTLEDIHTHDIVTLLDKEGIALRGGHHCAQPTMDRFGLSGTTRASMSFYNMPEELDRLRDGLKKVIKVFNK